MACVDCWALAEVSLTNLRLNMEWGEIVELAADLRGAFTLKTVWQLTASVEYETDGTKTLIPESPTPWAQPAVHFLLCVRSSLTNNHR